jgi:hypothetical protein
MRVLIIDDLAKAEIKRVVAHAEANRMGIHDLMRVIKRVDPPVGDRQGYECRVEDGFRCVFSIEQQPCGWMRHLSVSVPGGKYPNEHAVIMLAKEFGFAQPVENWKWGVEKEEEIRAVDVLEVI